MTNQMIYSYIISLIVASALVPFMMYVATKLDIVAKMNDRTIHTKVIGRIGGVAIYLSFLVGAMIFLKTDNQINSLLIGGFLMFSIGLLDDMIDLKARYKLVVQLFAALIVIFYGGIELKGFEIGNEFFSKFLTLIWIIGITNAINLIDGLDGLSAGISTIVLFTISFTSMASGRVDIASLSLILAGSLTGFLFYNFYPAKIFMGDSGALFIGFMIAVISLLGFGYNVSTFFTLGAPIVVLMIPIMDTLIAIIRRKIKGKKFSEADKKHLHHRLMYKFNLGHRKSVIVLYAVTILFSVTSFIYLYDPLLGVILFIVIMVFFELFIELSNMITAKYKPLLTLINIVLQRDDLPKLKMTEKYLNKKQRHTKWIAVVVVISLCLSIIVVMDRYGVVISTNNYEVIQSVYKKSDKDYVLLDEIYAQLDYAYKTSKREQEYQMLAAYFLVDYLSLGLHGIEVGGLDLVHDLVKEDFENYAFENDEEDTETISDLMIIDYSIISHSPSSLRISGIDSIQYFNVLISFSYNYDLESVHTAANVIVVLEKGIYYVVGIEHL